MRRGEELGGVVLLIKFVLILNCFLWELAAFSSPIAEVAKLALVLVIVCDDSPFSVVAYKPRGMSCGALEPCGLRRLTGGVPLEGVPRIGFGSTMSGSSARARGVSLQGREGK